MPDTPNIIDFLTRRNPSSSLQGPDGDIVLSSRARLARNLQDASFPAHAKRTERTGILKRIFAAFKEIDNFGETYSFETMKDIPPVYRDVLVEKHLISKELATKDPGSGLILSPNSDICIMVNEEDHLRMQAILPGLQVEAAWKMIDELDTKAADKLPFAFHKKYGFLTACPTNAGTGVRISAMLHLPALVLSNQIKQIFETVSKLHLTVRGIYGEGSEALGNLFQASNQQTLGVTEQDIVRRMDRVIRQIVNCERDARQKLMESRQGKYLLLNLASRAWTTLCNSYIIDSGETLNMLSAIRLSVDMGVFKKGSVSDINELYLQMQPGHLQTYKIDSGENIADQFERDVIRATILREKIKKFGPPEIPGINS